MTSFRVSINPATKFALAGIFAAGMLLCAGCGSAARREPVTEPREALQSQEPTAPPLADQQPELNDLRGYLFSP
ncbi:MAG: hypothetical protein GC154_04365 [bacterium]|nr:hypothetical protein [bacterium]